MEKKIYKETIRESTRTSSRTNVLPIKFTFTIHGLSGWKRGDKFKVVGLPSRYDNGFFQVTQINQQIEGMGWKTQIEGQFRNVSS